MSIENITIPDDDIFTGCVEAPCILVTSGFDDHRIVSLVELTVLNQKVPAPFPADFPEADLLKHKHYDVMSVKPEAWFESDDLLQKVDAVFRKMYKFNRFFNYTIDNQ